MADEPFTPITGAEDSPVDSGFIDDVNGQSVDLLLLDPERQSVAVADDPAALDPLGEIGARARLISDDPIPLRVARIHEEIQQILRLQRDICDGIELATDQVQDKRIEFLEAGPEVDVSSFFVEFALLFFVNSPLLGEALRRSFRFVGARILESRALRLERLGQLARTARSRLAEVAKASRANRVALIQNEQALRVAPLGRRHELLQKRSELNATQRTLDEKSRSLGRVIDRPEEVGSQAAVTDRALKTFFSEANESLAKDYGVAVVKGAVGPTLKATGAGGTAVAAADSIGVQIKALAQFQLRNVEMHLGIVAADADLLRSIAQSDPFLAPDCFAMLSDMLAALRGAKASGGGGQSTLDVRRRAMLEFEKLIWVLLMPDRTLDRPELIEDLQEEAEERPFGDPFLDSLVIGLATAAPFIGNPSERFMTYLNERFFPGEGLSTADMLKRLKQVKADFLRKATGETPIKIISVRFRDATPADGDGQSGTPAP